MKTHELEQDAMAGLSASGGSPSNRGIGRRAMKPEDNKFHQGAQDGKHYWLTPPELYKQLDLEFGFDFDPCPYPKPENFDGLTAEWGASNYVNIPFGTIMHDGKRKGATAWVRKAIAEHKKGKRVVLVHPLDKWVFMLLEAGAKIRNLRDVKWLATEDGTPGKGTGRHIAAFILEPSEPPSAPAEMENDQAHPTAAGGTGGAQKGL